MGDVIRFRAHNGQEIFAAFEHLGEAEIEFFKQGFIGIVHNGELVGKEDPAGCVGVVQVNLGLVSEHKL